MGKRRLCHITTGHPIEARIFFKECKTLVQAGYEVYLVISHNKDEQLDGVLIRALPKPSGRFERMTTNVIRAYRRALETGSETFHFHDPELVIAGILLKLRGFKVIYDVHENFSSQSLYKEWLGPPIVRRFVSLLVKLIENVACIFFDRIVAATPDIVANFPKHKTFLVRNMPILGMIGDIPKSQIQKSVPVLIYSGGLSRARGIKEMVQALPFLENQAELWLMGSWENNKLLDECKRELGWKNVRYFGQIPLVEVYGLTKAADIGLVTYLPEEGHMTAIPNKPFECMACGLPLVVSEFPLWREMFSGCALLVDPRSPKEIARAIDRLLSEAQLRADMGERSRKLVAEEYSWEAEGKVLLKCYRDLIGETR